MVPHPEQQRPARPGPRGPGGPISPGAPDVNAPLGRHAPAPLRGRHALTSRQAR
ncbi:hypothetical protein STRAU_4533 [Streptomyces aurantiacus JA 4570]|uniref:Uncharacterized protein n=1 Tax=Streptomyces aurantiacus JA 4570 TaxID=1286094 RepID=S3ZVH8_9ACTN|nr:hypothetical protein STRAU_4533 [Streptomyces aurantiacus JA 4570]